ncbi:hypothetical protein BDY21DRAFT_372348 [Lineolata rhizophorae]|uniref:Uncharacterized protein n=1 Tax=Lineolata rhizophorae TaxID=578093 RepID=A0A6A6NZ81_9PEZI|nr:hypothetical protein BDY21DRAFT_372348 [Lineolata rhizophorae]
MDSLDSTSCPEYGTPNSNHDSFLIINGSSDTSSTDSSTAPLIHTPESTIDQNLFSDFDGVHFHESGILDQTEDPEVEHEVVGAVEPSDASSQVPRDMSLRELAFLARKARRRAEKPRNRFWEWLKWLFEKLMTPLRRMTLKSQDTGILEEYGCTNPYIM